MCNIHIVVMSYILCYIIIFQILHALPYGTILVSKTMSCVVQTSFTRLAHTEVNVNVNFLKRKRLDKKLTAKKWASNFKRVLLKPDVEEIVL